MSTQQIIVALLRGTHVAAVISLFGTLVFLALVAPSATAEAPKDVYRLRQCLLHLSRVSGLCALIIGIAWLVMESAIIAGTDTIAMTLHAVPVVALRTQFGQWLLLRCVLLFLVLPLLGSQRAGITAVVATIALAVQPMLGHAGAIGGSVGATLIVSEGAHLLAAGAWLGGLLPLFIAINTLTFEPLSSDCWYFASCFANSSSEGAEMTRVGIFAASSVSRAFSAISISEPVAQRVATGLPFEASAKM